MERNPSWEAYRFSASQEIPRIVWNLKVLHRIQKYERWNFNSGNYLFTTDAK